MQHMQNQFAIDKSTDYIVIIPQISPFNRAFRDWLCQAFVLSV